MVRTLREAVLNALVGMEKATVTMTAGTLRLQKTTNQDRYITLFVCQKYDIFEKSGLIRIQLMHRFGADGRWLFGDCIPRAPARAPLPPPADMFSGIRLWNAFLALAHKSEFHHPRDFYL